jgi:two-component system OmpR family response regulator
MRRRADMPQVPACLLPGKKGPLLGKSAMGVTGSNALGQISASSGHWTNQNAKRVAEVVRGLASDRGSVGQRVMSVPDSPRVLLIGEKSDAVSFVAGGLRLSGYVTIRALKDQALAASRKVRPEILILDVQKPDLDGFAVVRELRQHDIDVPVLFLIEPGEMWDEAVGLITERDDYLAKPFALDEVLARIQKLRLRVHPHLRNDAECRVLRFADLEFDSATCSARRAGVPLQLTPKESKILRYLMSKAEQVVSRAQILAYVWPYDYTGTIRVVDVHVCTLRRKIRRYGPAVIDTVHGTGYALRRPAP